MPCKNYRAQLSLYMGGELDPTAMLAVDTHVRSCPSCQSTAAAFQAQRTILGRFGRGLDSLGAAPDLFSGLAPHLGASHHVGGRPSLAVEHESSLRSSPMDRRGPLPQGYDLRGSLPAAGS